MQYLTKFQVVFSTVAGVVMTGWCKLKVRAHLETITNFFQQWVLFQFYVRPNQLIPGNVQKYVSTIRSLLQCKTLPAYLNNNTMVYFFIKRYIQARWMAAVPSEVLRTILWTFVILLTANFKFRNYSTCSKGPKKRANKVCGNSQDLKSPGWTSVVW